MSTLKAINETLMTQNAVLGLIGQEQTNTTRALDRLNTYFDMQADDLAEAEGENRGEQDQAQASRGATPQSSEMGMLEGMFDKKGFLASLLGGKGLKLLLGGVAVVLADEIGNLFGSITGSEIAGSLAEAGLVGAGLGSVFGIKGAIFGALILGTVRGSQIVAEETAKYLKKQDFPAPTIAGEIAAAFSLATAGAAAGFVKGGPPGAIIGAIAGLAAGGLATTYKYLTDPEFQTQIDAELNELQSIINNISDAVNNWLEENVRQPLVGVYDGIAEFVGASTSADRTAPEVKAIQNKIDDNKQTISDMTEEFQALNRSRKSFRGAKTDEERQAVIDYNKDIDRQVQEIKEQQKALYKENADLRREKQATISAITDQRQSGVSQLVDDVAAYGNRNVPAEPEVVTPAQTGAEVTEMVDEGLARAAASSQTVVGQVGDTNVSNNSQNLISGVLQTANINDPYWSGPQPRYP